MEVILKEDVKNLGSKHDLVKVRPGYARNFLFPQGFAVEATEGRRKEVAEITKQRSHKEEKLRTAAQKIADFLKDVTIKVGAKAGEKGKISVLLLPSSFQKQLKNWVMMLTEKTSLLIMKRTSKHLDYIQAK